MKMQFVMATLAAALLGCSSTLAQVGGMGTSPLSATSPLATGSGSPVAPTGIPLGATQMTAPGTAPAPPAPQLTIGSPAPMGTTPPCPVTGTFPDGTTTRQSRSGSGATTIVPGC